MGDVSIIARRLEDVMFSMDGAEMVDIIKW